MSCDVSKIKINQIRRYRKKRYLLQQDVAKLLKLQQENDIYRWETGTRIPSLANAIKLSVALNCPIEILFLEYFQQIQKEMYPDKSNKKTT